MDSNNRRHVDDAATTLVHHNRSASMDEIESALQVHCYHSIPLLFCHLQHQTVFGDSSIVDQNVNTAEFFHHFVYNLLCLSKIGCIAGIAFGLYAQCGNLTFCSQSAMLLIDEKICKCNIRSFRSKLQRDGLANATCRACNQRGLAFQ